MEKLEMNQHDNEDITILDDSNSNEPILSQENRRFTIFPIKYQSIWDLYKKQQSLYWRAEEIDFSKDYDDFKKLNKDEQHFVKMILAFFAASDGIVNFNLRERFLNDVQIMEAQVAYGWQMMMESIHCVSADTQILTDHGYHKIIDLLEKKINVWNGKEFSETIVKYTGDSVLYRAKLTNGMKLDCTPNHKWFIEKNKYDREIVFTNNLKVGDIIYNYDLPIVDVEDSDNFYNPYIHGFYCGNDDNNFNIFITKNNRQICDNIFKESIQIVNENNGYRCDVTGKINKDKFFVPTNYSINTKLKWLEGLCNSDKGRIVYDHDKFVIQIINKNLDFLHNIQLMLTTLGINCNISHNRLCKNDRSNNHYLTLYNYNNLVNLGFKIDKITKIQSNSRLRFNSNPEIIKIQSITKLKGIHKTFCFCENNEHAGIFNGILTGQSEVYSQMLENIVKNPQEKNKLFNAIENVDSVKLMAEWAFKWIESTKSFAYRLVAFAIVEGIFFSGAFAAIFWLKKYRAKGKHFLNGLIKSNEFIARDEGMHVEFACALYKLLIHKLSKEDVYVIMDEAIKIAQLFTNDAIQCKLIGMNTDLMSQYIEYIGDRLLVMLGYPKKYLKKNPLDFMETIGLSRKSNFFETRSTEYQSAHNSNNTNERKIIRLDKF